VDAFVRNFLQLLLYALSLLVLARVILSWVDPRASNGISQLVVQATEPMLAPIRRFMPSTGMIDFSPTILLVALLLLSRML
jgi:YggT family protein